MSVELESAKRLNALKSKADAKTGETSDTLADAVDTLIAGYEPGGGDSYYDEFWDKFQNNGERTRYWYGFVGEGWTDETAKIKYPITVGSVNTTDCDCDSMFRESLITKLPDNVIIGGFYKAQIVSYCSYLKTFPPLDLSLPGGNVAGSIGEYFRNCKSLETIEINNIGEKQTFLQTFNSCSSLKNLILSGTIGNNFPLGSSSLLTNDSVQNIIDCLKDLTGTSAKTLTLHANVKAELTDDQIAAITGKNWTLA